MEIARIKARWTIPGAGTAYSILHFRGAGIGEIDDADADAATMQTYAFFNSIKAYLPGVVKIDVLSDVEVIDDATGTMTDVRLSTTREQVVGGSGASATWSAPSGACVTWNTGGVRNGRRVRGRTFVVPLATMAYGSDGTLDSTPLSTMQAAATLLAQPFSNRQLVVFARPTAPGAGDGLSVPVTSARITDQAAILKSRRN